MKSIRMKVLIVTGIFPPDIGGPATYVPQVATGLVERGHSVTVLTLSDRLDHEDRFPFRVVRLPRKRGKLRRQATTILRILKLGRSADVLFVNGLAFEAALANLILRKPLVLKVVGDLAWERAIAYGWVKESFEEFQQRRHGLRVELLKRLRTWWTRRADAVIVPSRYLARWVARWGIPEEKLVVIYNALEPADGIQPAQLPLPTSFNAVTVGRLVPWKRIDQILQAASQLEKLGLVIVGDGPERERLEQMAQDLGLKDRVYFAGSRSKSETLALMAACDVFVLNSTYEGLPHVVLEAMSLGLPVVATAVGGTPEVVQEGKTGILLDPSGEELVLALMQLREHNVRQQIAEQGRLIVAQKFNVQAMLHATEHTLTQLVLHTRGGVNEGA